MPFETAPRGVPERAVLIHVELREGEQRETLDEFLLLARSAGLRAVRTITTRRTRLDPKYFIGSGKAEEVRRAVVEEGADMALFNHALTPAQERNLERLIECRVFDRTTLILDIFAQRARSHAGKLQVELAQLRRLSTRLVRGWSHLERQKGGIGLRGPGETQLETDRRLIGQRIDRIARLLRKVHSTRALGRRARRRGALPTASLVGYSNAGKSTLFNRLTRADAQVADRLFATLDPHLRRLAPEWAAEFSGPLVLADTVGFIRHLPHELIAAFRATLEEIAEADLLLHVVDGVHEERDAQIEQVRETLERIGAAGVPLIEVRNKIDRMEGMTPRLERDAAGAIRRVWLSAATGAGAELLLEALREQLHGAYPRGSILLGPEEGSLRARLFAAGRVRAERIDERGGRRLDVELPPQVLDDLRLSGRFHPVQRAGSSASPLSAQSGPVVEAPHLPSPSAISPTASL